MTIDWTTRPDNSDDAAAVRVVNEPAFAASREADLIEVLRADPAARMPGLSYVTETAGGTVVA